MMNIQNVVDHNNHLHWKTLFRELDVSLTQIFLFISLSMDVGRDLLPNSGMGKGFVPENGDSQAAKAIQTTSCYTQIFNLTQGVPQSSGEGRSDTTEAVPSASLLSQESLADLFLRLMDMEEKKFHQKSHQITFCNCISPHYVTNTTRTDNLS